MPGTYHIALVLSCCRSVHNQWTIFETKISCKDCQLFFYINHDDLDHLFWKQSLCVIKFLKEYDHLNNWNAEGSIIYSWTNKTEEIRKKRKYLHRLGKTRKQQWQTTSWKRIGTLFDLEVLKEKVEKNSNETKFVRIEPLTKGKVNSLNKERKLMVHEKALSIGKQDYDNSEKRRLK